MDTQVLQDQEVVAEQDTGVETPVDETFAPDAVDTQSVPDGEGSPITESAGAVEAVQLAQIQAQLEQERQYRMQLEQEREAFALQQSQFQAQQARAQWEQEEARVLAHAQTLDYDEALKFTQNFYRSAMQQRDQLAQQAVQRANTNLYRTEVVKNYGLSPEEAPMLGNDPYQFDVIAKAIAAKNAAISAELKTLREQVKQVSRGNRAADRLGTGIDKNGIGNSRGAPLDTSQLSTQEHLRLIMEQNGVLPRV